MPIDAGLPWGRAWHRDKHLVATDDADEIARAAPRARTWRWSYGPEELVEGRGLGYRDLCAANPALVYARCRPSRTSTGTVEDYGLLVEARSGFCTQLAGHRPGPIFIDVRAPGGGTALLLPTSVLALLGQRARTGAGGWAETSLYDGMLATLGCMIGRSERAAPEIEGYWEKGSTFPNFLYRCADDELIQVWFGGKGMYAKLIEVLGDEPSAGRLLQRPDDRHARRAGRALDVVLRHPAPRRLDPPAPGGGRGLRARARPGRGAGRPAPGRDRPGRPARSDGRHRDVVLGSPVAVRPLRRTPVRPLAPNEPSSPPRRAALTRPR